MPQSMLVSVLDVFGDSAELGALLTDADGRVVTANGRLWELLEAATVNPVSPGTDVQAIFSRLSESFDDPHGFLTGVESLRRARRSTSRELLTLQSGTTLDRKSTRLNSSHVSESRMPSSA